MKRRTRIAVGASLICLSLGLASCGGSETTTVIKEAPASAPETVERTTTVQAPAPTPAPKRASTSSQEPAPNVIGLPLPTAQHLLKQAGYKTAAKNTDTTFGILVPANYTICRQGKPRGDLVVVLAQKYGC